MKAQRWLLIPSLLYVFVVVSFPSLVNLRYLIPPLVPLSIVSCSVVLEKLFGRFSRRVTRFLAVLLVVVVLLPTSFVVSLWLSRSMKLTLGYAIGRSSQQEYLLHSSFPYEGRRYKEILQYVNQTVPHDGLVLMLFEGRGYYFEVPVLQDNVFTNWQYLVHKQSSLECLKGTKISHVLVGNEVFNYLTKRGFNPDLIQWNVFQEFAQRCLTPIYQGGGYTLYEVRR